ncbi:hypothetical protein B0H19DRAFT_935958, partial [Mycena capillaripes]
LPFYALVSLLAKFPTCRDSRVFWGPGLRDLLRDVTFAAEDADPELIKEVVRTALGCQGWFLSRPLVSSGS